ncbi:hypothetical protein [Paenibacillus sp. y28]|uniref:hypothetical protein n=1 Tax=Paenibacillus sp. y28 TaxID=3129110 RepID=UPI0030191C35
MKGNGDAAAALADYVYKLESVERVNTLRPSFYQQKTRYGLLLVREGDGELVIAGRSYSFKRHKAFILPRAAWLCCVWLQAVRGIFIICSFMRCKPRRKASSSLLYDQISPQGECCTTCPKVREQDGRTS